MSAQAPDKNEWPSLRYAWFVVIVLMTLYIFSFIDRMIIALLVTPIKADLNLTDTDIGLLHGLAFALFYTFVGVFIARLADNWNRSKLIAIGVLLWGIATAACGLAGSFASLFAARVLVGIGEATLSPAAYSLISDYFPPEKRARAMSLYTSGIYFGVGVALIFGGIVIGLVESTGGISLPVIGPVEAWQVVFFVVGLPGVLFFVVVRLFVREPERREVSATPPTFAAFRAYFSKRRRLYLSHYLGFSFLVLYSYSFSAWTPAVITRSFGWTSADAGLWLGLVIFISAPSGIMLGSLLSQRFQKRWGTGAALQVGVIAALAGIIPAVLFPLATTAWMSLALMGVTQFVISLPFGVAPAALHEVTPNQYRGQIIAIYLFFINIIGLGTGPTIVGLITDYGFGNESAVGYSLLIMALIFLPLSGFILIKAAKTFRDHQDVVAS
ncbi:MAG: MFS transporter [Woeseiaceae bacterium]